MKADDLARTLVPALLAKSDRIRRGRRIRTGSSNIDEAGIHELGFMLGGALSSPDIQSAFGIARKVVESTKFPMLTQFLPQFFLASGQKLEENVRSVLSLLHDETRGDRVDYMIIRDECVFSKGFNLLHGFSDLKCLIFCFIAKAAFPLNTFILGALQGTSGNFRLFPQAFVHPPSSFERLILKVSFKAKYSVQ